MRSRLPLILIALTVLFAVAGCGDDKSTPSSEVIPAGSAPSSNVGSTGSTGSAGDASASVKSTLDLCLQAAEALPDSSESRKAKKRCQDAYDKIKDSTGKIDQATSDARAQCEEAAKKITNEQAKASTLAACAQFK